MLKVATDCSGIGSPEQALHNLQIPHEIVFACEKDKYARQTYLANFKPNQMFEDMTTRDNSDTSLYADLYLAGIPCQSFSLAGKRYGFINNEGYYQTYSAIEPEVKINQHIVVMDGNKTHNCKVISFNKKTRLIEIKINKKPAMCFKYANGGYYLVSKNPNK